MSKGVFKIWDNLNKVWVKYPSIKGDKGDQGDTGPQGPIGPKGDKGDIGPEADLSNYYTKTEVNTAIQNALNSAWEGEY